MLTENVDVEEKIYNPLGECWICGQWIYSLIFWSESIGDLHSDFRGMKQYHAKESVINQLRKHYPQIEPMNPRKPRDYIEERKLNLLTYYEEDDKRPLISLEYTNWKPTRMLRIDEFVNSIDKETREGIDLVEQLKKSGRISANAGKSPYDLE